MDVPAKRLSMALDDLMGTNRYALLSVAPIYDYVEGQRSDSVIATRYSVANPETFEKFDVKVANTKAIVSQDIIDSVDERVWVAFENAQVKPYRIEYGKAICSVTADSVKRL